MSKKFITLKNLLIDQEKCIGLKFFNNRVIQALVNDLPGVKWSDQYGMNYISNTSAHLDIIFTTFRGIAWINCSHFYFKGTFGREKEPRDVQWLHERKPREGRKYCPEEYLKKLELKCYSINTIKTYVSCFEAFINHYSGRTLEDLNEDDIRSYLQKLIRNNCSHSYINQAINSIKFYYEVVLEMPKRFYSIERPRRKEKLPEVLSKEEVIELLKIQIT